MLASNKGATKCQRDGLSPARRNDMRTTTARVAMPSTTPR